jgi:ERCC4-type nuclease
VAELPEIVVDIHERSSGIAASLARLGIGVTVRHLDIGDYLVESSVIVERKAVPDLHMSVRQGRLWRQVWELIDTGRRPFLLVEGDHLAAGPLDEDALRASLLAIGEHGITVVRSRGAADSAQWLRLMALRAWQRDRPPYRVNHPRKRRRPRRVAEAALVAVPGISVVTARALLDRFGSLRDVVGATPEEWMEVRGVGRARAAALARTFESRQR